MGMQGLAPLFQGEMNESRSTWWVKSDFCLDETPGTSFLKNNQDSVTAAYGCHRRGSRGKPLQGMLLAGGCYE